MHNTGIAFRLSMSILICVSVIFLIIFGYDYITSRQIISRNIDNNAYMIARASVNEIESELRAVQKIPLNLANMLENSNPSASEIEQMLKSALQNNPEISGAIIAFESFAFDSQIQYFTPYCYRNDDASVQLMSELESPQQVYYYDWYRLPFRDEKPKWSEPYYHFRERETVMATYSVPLYRFIDGKKRVVGVVAADVKLTFLQKIVSSIKVGKSGYGILISSNGTIMAHRDKNLIMKQTLFSVAEMDNDMNLRRVARAMIKGKSGFVPVKNIHDKENSWIVYEPLKSSSWSLGVLLPKKELMADITLLNRNVFIFVFIGFCIVLLVTVFVSGTITRPLRRLVQTTEEISGGNLDFSLPERFTHDETGRLTQSFGTMRDALKKHIKQLTTAIAAKERIESELKIAHDIQTNMIPRIFPPFPDRKEIDLYAMIQPAREVGGDFFDFFFVDDFHLFFYIADVAGKGVPASLFMAVTRTLIKIKCSSGLQPQTVMTSVNNDLCMDNDSCMFVTAFCGMLNVATGELVHVNCGHNPPLLCRVGETFQLLDIVREIALGVMPGVSFRSRKTILSEGDTIFIYTDGVNEALNPRKQMFGLERLKQALNNETNQKTSDMVCQVYATIETFTEGEEQSDDITMLALTYTKQAERSGITE